MAPVAPPAALHEAPAQPVAARALRARVEDVSSPPGPLADALALVGDRWSLAVVAQLVHGPQRFNELADALAPIARTVLSDRLRKLEVGGIIVKRQYSENPPRARYRLTLAGAELARVCGVLADWSARHLGDGAPAMTHAACGGAITPVYECVRCGVVPARELAH
jgi:DNA-binding HxlR family transcriptional regulator